MIKTARLASVSILAVLFLAVAASAQTDPGVQSGNRGTGAALSSVLANDVPGILAFFNDGLKRFQDVESVSNSPTGNNGLGPRFNSNSCSSCHSQPAIGGTGPAMNPEFSFTSNGVAPRDTTPSFITANGPTLEARFPFFFNSNGTVNYNAPNGGVETLFTVSGRSDAGSCSLQQPSFAQAQATNNLIFRIPTPTFGTGLIENLDDSTLLNNQAELIGGLRVVWDGKNDSGAVVPDGTYTFKLKRGKSSQKECGRNGTSTELVSNRGFRLLQTMAFQPLRQFLIGHVRPLHFSLKEAGSLFNQFLFRRCDPHIDTS